MIFLKLFLTFLKVGAVSFGGGYGMISIIRDDCLANGWLTEEELLNFIAVAESTPGPIAVNMATFVGSSQGGVLGAFLATLGTPFEVSNADGYLNYAVIPEADTLTVTFTEYNPVDDNTIIGDMYRDGEYLYCDEAYDSDNKRYNVFHISVTAGEPCILEIYSYNNMTVTFD